MITGAIRVGFSRATASSKTVRLVFDFAENAIWLEEGDQPHLVQSKDVTGTGGAAASTMAEKQALEDSSRILKGPTAPRTAFKEIDAMGRMMARRADAETNRAQEEAQQQAEAQRRRGHSGVVAPRSSPRAGVQTVEDIKGKKMAFTSQTSNSGFKAPSALLKEKFGLDAGKDFDPVFSGKHDNSIVGVANKDYPAAAIANSVMQRMMARGVVKKDQIVTIYKSKTFPTTGYGMVYNLKPELAAKVKEH
jgi:ABC-type phosphate/phosphonate transport system substrate-binding protein